jgi:hypothetical protein
LSFTANASVFLDDLMSLVAAEDIPSFLSSSSVARHGIACLALLHHVVSLCSIGRTIVGQRRCTRRSLLNTGCGFPPEEAVAPAAAGVGGHSFFGEEMQQSA